MTIFTIYVCKIWSSDGKNNDFFSVYHSVVNSVGSRFVKFFFYFKKKNQKKNKTEEATENGEDRLVLSVLKKGLKLLGNHFPYNILHKFKKYILFFTNFIMNKLFRER